MGTVMDGRDRMRDRTAAGSSMDVRLVVVNTATCAHRGQQRVTGGQEVVFDGTCAACDIVPRETKIRGALPPSVQAFDMAWVR